MDWEELLEYKHDPMDLEELLEYKQILEKSYYFLTFIFCLIELILQYIITFNEITADYDSQLETFYCD